MSQNVVLEKAALEVAKQASIPPLIFNLPVDEGARVLENVQNTYHTF